MKRKIVKLVLPVVVLAGALSSHVANAQSCSTWASNILASAGGGLGVRLTTNRSDGRYVSYAASAIGNPLIYVPGHWSGRVYLPPSLQGTVSQFFSDRTYDWDGALFPFAPTETDTLNVTIWLGTGTNIQPGEVTFTLVTWGNAIVNFVPERCDGMVYGLSGNTGLLLSVFTDIPIK